MFQHNFIASDILRVAKLGTDKKLLVNESPPVSY